MDASVLLKLPLFFNKEESTDMRVVLNLVLMYRQSWTISGLCCAAFGCEQLVHDLEVDVRLFGYERLTSLPQFVHIVCVVQRVVLEHSTVTVSFILQADLVV